MRCNLWLPFQLTLVNTLCVGVGVRPTNVLSIDRHRIDQWTLFDNELCCNSIIHPSIDQKKYIVPAPGRIQNVPGYKEKECKGIHDQTHKFIVMNINLKKTPWTRQ